MRSLQEVRARAFNVSSVTLFFILQVSEIYDQVHQSMIQTPIKDNVPFFWSTMSQVKANHYRSMAHYFVASALLDHQCKGKYLNLNTICLTYHFLFLYPVCRRALSFNAFLHSAWSYLKALNLNFLPKSSSSCLRQGWIIICTDRHG